MAVFSISRRVPARPPTRYFGFRYAFVAMWASVAPWLPTRAGFWAMTVGQPFVLARVRHDGPSRFRSTADRRLP